MPLSPPEQWPRVAELFSRAMEIPSAERGPFVRAATEEPLDAALRDEVLGLLASAEALGLQEPVEAEGGLADADPLVGRTVGEFTIMARIAEGGMGVVYDAEQHSPRRRVALKVVRGDIFGPDVAVRFAREAELLGRLQHPGIAAIFAAGAFRLDPRDPSTSRAYYAMELVEGARITDYVAARAPSRDELLLLLALVADAVDHAHRRGVIHRDLKPGNILVTPDGVPKIVDFGIAMTIEPMVDRTLRTREGDLIGTLGYMAPEQIAGDRARIDARTDIYALGVVAYEVLLGRLPVDVRGLSIPEALERLRTEEPVSLGALRRDLRGDIATVVGAAMATEPARRYASAAAMARDLRNIVDSRPIMARPPGFFYHLRRFVGRHRAASVAGALAVGLLFAAVAGTSIGWRRAAAEAERVRRVNEVLHGVLRWLDPGVVGGGEVSLRRALDEASLRVERELPVSERLAVELHELLGERYVALGLHDRAERQYRLAESVAEASGSVAPADRARRLARIGNARAAQGDFDAGLALIEEATSLREVALPPDSLEIAESRHNLAVVLRGRGDVQRALESIDRAILLVERHHPNRIAELSWSLAQKGTILMDLGRTEEAVAVARRALGMRDEIKPDDLATATLLERLAEVLVHDLAEPATPDRLLERVVRIRRSLLPGNHADLQRARCGLAKHLLERGRVDEAQHILMEADAALRDAPVASDAHAAIEAPALGVEINRLLEACRIARSGA